MGEKFETSAASLPSPRLPPRHLAVGAGYYTPLTPTLKLSMVQMLGLSALGAVAGGWIKRRLPVLDRLNIPAPIVGGMIYALIALLLRDRVVNLEADAGLRDLLQIAFFTTIGLSVRMETLRKGGAALMWLLAAASVGALLQNVL